MHVPLLLFAAFQPSIAVAPWECFEAIPREDSYFSAAHYLTSTGADAGDFISWTANGFGSAVWRIQDRSAWTLRAEFLGFAFTVPHRPTSPLILRVEADGRVVARIPVRPQIEPADQGGLETYVRLSRTPDREYPPHGPVPAIGAPQRLVGTLEERGGHVLATVSIPLPDGDTLRTQGQQSLQRALEKAANYSGDCRDRRQPVPVPPPLPVRG